MRYALLLLALVLGACTHLKGVVLEEPSGRPARTAVFSVGNPIGIAVYGQHSVDRNGEFDFYVGPTDDNIIYLFDGSAPPEMTMRRLAPYELGEKMQLHLRPATPGTPSLPAGALISPF
jgi:hypothetical protein